MNILVSNHHLNSYAGSEMFTLTLADYLVKNGHRVTVYSKFFNLLRPEFENKEARIVTSLEQLKDEKFDLAHVHYNINALEIRHCFPLLPMVYMCHGIIPFLEQPPVIDLHISKFLAVSEGVRDHLIKEGVSPDRIMVVRNLIDSSLFFEEQSIQLKPKKALILSSKIDPEKEDIILEGCEICGIEASRLGQVDNLTPNSKLSSYINQADIVFSLGRGAMESMFCGRIPFVFDHMGGDGIVTPNNFYSLLSKNFSGRLTFTKYTPQMIAGEIRDNYSVDSAQQLKKQAKQEFDASTQSKKIIEIYKQIIDTPIPPVPSPQMKLIDHTYNQIATTKVYSENEICRTKDAEIKRLTEDLNLIQSSKTYKVWQMYTKFKKSVSVKKKIS